MRKILVATRSAGKQREIRKLLADIDAEVVFPADLDLTPQPEEDQLENTGTYEGNAWRKAVHFARLSGLPTAADDSGIEVRWLRGAPGVRSRRFAPPAEDQDEANNDHLLEELEDVEGEARAARYRCVVVFVASPESPPVEFEGVCDGRILTERTGTAGFGYDPLFFSHDLGKSFGEATPEEKQSVSHRGRAFREFAHWLKSSAGSDG